VCQSLFILFVRINLSTNSRINCIGTQNTHYCKVLRSGFKIGILCGAQGYKRRIGGLDSSTFSWACPFKNTFLSFFFIAIKYLLRCGTNCNCSGSLPGTEAERARQTDQDDHHLLHLLTVG
jgi:hypothetical protein